MLYSTESTSEEYLTYLDETIKYELQLKELYKLNDISGGLVNKAAVYATEKGNIFIKYAERENVSCGHLM